MKFTNPIISKSNSPIFSLHPIQITEEEFHSCEALSIVFIHSGHGTGEINGNTFEYHPSSIICINETERLFLHKSNHFQGKILTFSPSLIREYFNFENLRNYDHRFTADDIGLVIYLSVFFQRFPNYIGYIAASDPVMKKLDRLLSTLSAYDRAALSNSLIDILIPIKKLVQVSLSVSNAIIIETNFEIKDVLLYLHNHCSQKITIPKLSKQFHVNRTTLSDRFFEATGETIITYLNKYRINLAAIMLRESTDSISVIAEKVGFNDTAYFAKLFKKYMLHTPSGYRSRYVSLFHIHEGEAVPASPQAP